MTQHETFETDTHEQRLLKNFGIGDYIVVRGKEYRVLMIMQLRDEVTLFIDDMHGTSEMIKDHQDLMFTARKRGL